MSSISKMNYIILEKSKGNLRSIVDEFTVYCQKHLKLKDKPEIKFVGKKLAEKARTFGKHKWRHGVEEDGRILIDIEDRHPVDILRTVAHEIVHHKQDVTKKKLSDEVKEDEANAEAGRLVRTFVKKRGHLFGLDAVEVKKSYVILEKGKGTRPPTIGVDFDGVIVKPNDYSAIKDAEVYPEARQVLQKFKDRGWKIVIDTCRSDEKELKRFLDGAKIPYNWINKNPLQPKDVSPTKIYTDIKLDDRVVTFRGWGRALKDVLSRQKQIKEMRRNL